MTSHSEEKAYMAYVGPQEQYDFMGATQFRLLCSLGLRQNHRLLDVGCGSLRAGRFFVSYLETGNYHGIEPNKWLIEEAIENQIGRDLFALKKPEFYYNSEFEASAGDKIFDYIVAQSIFSHTGNDLLRKALKNLKKYIKPNGLIVATFVEGKTDFEGDGWIYPDCVTFRTETVIQVAGEFGFYGIPLPWYHPRQTWYVFSEDANKLPKKEQVKFLNGVVLNQEAFKLSWYRPTLVSKVLRKVKKIF